MDTYLRRYLGGPVSPENQHAFRSMVLERATWLDLGMSDVLSVRTGRDIYLAAELAADVYGRLPVGTRIGMVESLIEEQSDPDRWPFVVPVLKAAFALRNQLAHGMPSWRSGSMEVRTFNRGRSTVRTYTPESLGWLLWQMEVASDELDQLWAAVVPTSKKWHRDRPRKSRDG